jgi:cysteine desulfurase
VPDLAGKELLDLFDAAGVRVSAGSACSAAKAAPSYVLEAMGLPALAHRGAVRLSFGPLATTPSSMKPARASALRPGGAASGADGLRPGRRATGLQQVSFEGATAGSCSTTDRAPASRSIRPPAWRRGSRPRWRAAAARAGGAGHGRRPAGARCARRVRGTARGPGLETRDAGTLGWPRDSGIVTLADGSAVPAIAIGNEVLARLASQDGRGAVYLLGRAADGVLDAAAVRLAFIGGAVMADAGAPGLARLMDGGTVLCHGADIGGAYPAPRWPACAGRRSGGAGG